MSHTYTTTLGLSVGGDCPTWEGDARVTYTLDDDGDVEELTVTHIDGEPVSRIEYGAQQAATLEEGIWNRPALLAVMLADAAEFEVEALERRQEARAEWGMQ